MNKKVWTNLMVAMLVLGLFMTVSCAKKTVVSDGTAIEDQASLEAERERIKAEEMARESALSEAKTAAARAQFENQNIHFDFDSAELSPMAKTLLKEKAEWLSANPGVSVVVEGHCDDRGTTEYNIALGEKRALAAKNYLVDLGVSEARLSTVSFGEERPLDSASTEEAYSKNRRAQFVL